MDDSDFLKMLLEDVTGKEVRMVDVTDQVVEDELYRIRPLVWQEIKRVFKYGTLVYLRVEANIPMGVYEIITSTNEDSEELTYNLGVRGNGDILGGFFGFIPGQVKGEFDTLEEAQDYAWDCWQKAIAPALELSEGD